MAQETAGINIELTMTVNEARAELNRITNEARNAAQVFKNLDSAAKINPDDLNLASNAMEALSLKYSKQKEELLALQRVQELQTKNVAEAKAHVEKLALAEGENSEATKKAKDSLRMLENGLEATNKKLPKLSSEIKLTEQQLLAYEEALKDNAESQSKTSLELQKATQNYEQEKKTLANVTKEVANYKAAIKGSDDQYEATSKYLESLNKQYDQQRTVIGALESKIQLLKIAHGDLSPEVKDAESQLAVEYSELQRISSVANAAGYELVKLSNDQEDVADSTAKSNNQINAMTVAMGNLIAQGIRRAISSFKELATSVYDTGSAFEEGMAGLAAIYQISSDSKDIEILSDTFRELATNSRYSAVQIAENASVLANAGYDVNQTKQALEAISMLAQGTGEEFDSMANIVVDGLHAFGMQASDAEHFANALAKAAVSSNTNVEMMGEAFKYAGTVAGSFGYRIEDTALALGIMASNGIKGTQAGTALRTMITRLAADTSHARETLEDLGGNFYDLEGNALPLKDVLDSLREAFAGLNDEEKASAAYTIAGQRGISALNAIVNMSAEEYDLLASKIDDSTGAVRRMSETRLDTLAGQVDVLSNRFDELKLSSYDRLEPALKSTTQRLNTLLDDPTVVANIEEISDSFSGLIGVVADVAEALLPHANTLVNCFEGIAASFAAVKAVGGINALGDLVGGRVELENFNPQVLALKAGIVALVGAFTAVKSSVEEFQIQFEVLHPEFKALKDEIEGVSQANEDMSSSMNETEQSASNAFTEIEKDSTKANILINRLDDLQGNLDGTEKSFRLNSDVVTELNNLYPSLNLKLGTNGQLLGTNTEEIRKNVSALKDMALAAAWQDKVTSATENYIDAQVNSAIATQKVADAEAALADAKNKTIKTTDIGGNVTYYQDAIAVQQYEQALKDAQDAEQESIRLEGEAKNALDVTSAAYDSYAAKVQDVTTNVENYGDAVSDSSMILYESLGLDTETVNNWSVAVSEAVDGASYSWFEYEEAEKASFSEMEANLQKNIDMISNWEENLAYLAENGASSTLLDYMIGLGTEGAPQVQALVDELKKGGDAFSEFDKKLQDAIYIDTFTEKLSTDALKAGTDVPKNISDGVKNGEGDVTSSVGDVANKANEKLDSMSEDAKGYGRDYMQGLADGINEKADVAVRAATDATSRINAAAKETMEIGSPSKLMKRFGSWYTEGLAIGINDAVPEAVKSAQALANKVNGVFQGGALKTVGIDFSPITDSMREATLSMNSLNRISYDQGEGNANKIVASNNAVVDALVRLEPKLTGARVINNYSVGSVSAEDGSYTANTVKALTKALWMDKKVI